MEGVYDAAVVGGGIMGLCTAVELARRGKSVILVEQFDFLHQRGSSHGESRMLRLTYPEHYYALMAKISLHLWEKAQIEASGKVYFPTGQLDFGHKEHHGLQEVIESCKKYGITYQVLTPAEVNEKFKVVQIPEDHIGVYTQDAGVLRADKAREMFLSLALKHGVVLQDNLRVTKISTGWRTPQGEDAVVVATSKGSILAKKCIIASGAWTSKVVKENFAVDLPIEPLQTYIAYWEVEKGHEEDFHANNGFPAFVCYSTKYFYTTPSLEYPGLLKASIHGGTPCDADKRDLSPDVVKLSKIMSPWISYTFMNKVNSDCPVKSSVCMYSMTPDQDFILDFVPNTKNQVLVAGGFSGHGFKMAPLVGKIMADLALDGFSEEISLQYFSVDRFARNKFGNSKGFNPVQEFAALNLDS